MSWVSTGEAADILDCSEHHLYNYSNRYAHLGVVLKVPRSDYARASTMLCWSEKIIKLAGLYRAGKSNCSVFDALKYAVGILGRIAPASEEHAA